MSYEKLSALVLFFIGIVILFSTCGHTRDEYIKTCQSEMELTEKQCTWMYDYNRGR